MLMIGSIIHSETSGLPALVYKLLRLCPTPVGVGSGMLMLFCAYVYGDASCGTAWPTLQHVISGMKTNAGEVHDLGIQAACWSIWLRCNQPSNQ